MATNGGNIRITTIRILGIRIAGVEVPGIADIPIRVMDGIATDRHLRYADLL
jgi:hypothetical protein